VAALAAAVMTTLGVLTVTATPASAATRDGTCQAGEFCWFNGGISVSCVYDAAVSSDSSLAAGDSATYPAGSSCPGAATDNSFNSIWNRSAGTYVEGRANTNYTGTITTGGTCVGPSVQFNLSSVNTTSSFRTRTLAQCA
jgi:hypothetical protein